MDPSARLVERAQLLVAAKRYDDALRIVSALPEDGDARLLASAAFFHKHEHKQALREVERAIALGPERALPHAFHSDVLYALGKKKESLGAAREAVRLDPEDAVSHWVLARSAWAIHDWKVAEQAAAETLRLAPEWPLAHGIAGLVSAGRRRRKEAQAHLRRALALDPNDPTLIHDFAVTKSRCRPRTETVKLLEDAVRLDPSDTQMADNLYVETTAHVRGGGFDRLDVFLGGPTLLLAGLTVAVLEGWIRLPGFLGTAVVAVFVPLLVAYAVADFIRNRERLRNLRKGTRALYLHRFYKDHWMGVAFFLLTGFVPLVIAGAFAASMGVPSQLVTAILVAVAVAWIGVAPLVWRARIKPWLTRGR